MCFGLRDWGRPPGQVLHSADEAARGECAGVACARELRDGQLLDRGARAPLGALRRVRGPQPVPHAGAALQPPLASAPIGDSESESHRHRYQYRSRFARSQCARGVFAWDGNGGVNANECSDGVGDEELCAARRVPADRRPRHSLVPRSARTRRLLSARRRVGPARGRSLSSACHSTCD